MESSNTSTGTVSHRLSLSGSLSRVPGSSSTDEIRLEKETIIKERTWFLSELPSLLSELRKVLQDSVDVITLSSEFSKKSKEEDLYSSTASKLINPQYITVESTDGIFKGQMRIEGFNIAESELVVKSNKWNKGTQYKTTVNPLNPFKITQLNNAFNYLKQTIIHLNECQHYVDNMNSIKDDVTKITNILKYVDLMEDCLKLSMDQLLLPSTNSFPRNLTMVYQPVLAFQPPLPLDLIIDITIQNKLLLLNCYCLHKIANTNSINVSQLNQSNNNTNINSLSASFKDSIVGQRYLLANQTCVEVIDFTQIQCNVTSIKTTAHAVSQSLQLCAELRDKLVLFHAF